MNGGLHKKRIIDKNGKHTTVWVRTGKKKAVAKMKLTEKQKKLFEFLKIKHADQVRKYTGEPYTEHLYSVAEEVSKFEPTMIEVALSHDFLEDVEGSTSDELRDFLLDSNYSEERANEIVQGVIDLTDVYTKEAYPELNRAKRKQLEAERLGKVNPKSQSVKYADLIDNTHSIAEHDKNFAKTYLEEKRVIIGLMKNGNKDLYDKVKQTLSAASKETYKEYIGKRISFKTSDGKVMIGTASHVGFNQHFGWFQVTVDRTPFRNIDPKTIKIAPVRERMFKGRL